MPGVSVVPHEGGRATGSAELRNPNARSRWMESGGGDKHDCVKINIRVPAFRCRGPGSDVFTHTRVPWGSRQHRGQGRGRGRPHQRATRVVPSTFADCSVSTNGEIGPGGWVAGPLSLGQEGGEDKEDHVPEEPEHVHHRPWPRADLAVIGHGEGGGEGRDFGRKIQSTAQKRVVMVCECGQ